MVHNPTPGWLAPAQRLVRDIADLYGQHLSDPSGSIDVRHDLTELLRAAHTLERCLCRPATTQPRIIQRDLLRLLSPIRVYCSLLADRLEQTTAQALRSRLLGIISTAEQVDQQLQQRAPGAPAPWRRPPPEPGRLLLIEADPQLLPLLIRAIRDAGHQLEHSPTVDAAVCDDILPPDLVLLGIGEPEGGERRLRALKQRGLAVLVLASAANQRELGRWLELGADDCIGAPLDPTLLQLRIRAILDRKRWQDQEQQLRHHLECNQRFIRQIFGRYLSPEIVDTLLEKPEGLDLGGVQRTVTVLLVDIRGFARVCEQLAPDRVMQLLNIYLGTMAEIVLAAQGTVDEFIGDAVLAIFGAPVSRYDDADRALQCALEMQRAVGEINVRNAAHRLPAIEIGISLNTGRVVAGNIGSELRSKYAVVGHVVNQTARIDEICPGGDILVSAATLRALQHMACIGTSMPLQARGMVEPIEVFQVVSMGTRTAPP